LSCILRCQDGKTDLFIDWGEFISTQNRIVEWRIGEAEAVTSEWNISTDYEATFFPGFTERSATCCPFIYTTHPVSTTIKAMFGEKLFVARVTPYAESRMTAVFDITGIEHAVANVREACSW